MYNFGGGEEVTTDTDFRADATVYAHWTAAQCTITVNAAPPGRTGH